MMKVSDAISFAKNWLRKTETERESETPITDLSQALLQLNEKLLATWNDFSLIQPPVDEEVLICGTHTRTGKEYCAVAEYDGELWYDKIGDSLPVNVRYWKNVSAPDLDVDTEAEISS